MLPCFQYVPKFNHVTVIELGVGFPGFFLIPSLVGLQELVYCKVLQQKYLGFWFCQL